MHKIQLKRAVLNKTPAKQPPAWREHCAEYWLKDLRESMDRCTGRRDVTKIQLKTALNTIQSINQRVKNQIHELETALPTSAFQKSLLLRLLSSISGNSFG